MKVVLGAFGPFLNQKTNSSQKLLAGLEVDPKVIKKIILPVKYGEHSFIKPMKKYQPEIYIIVGNDDTRKKVYLESKAKNKHITLKSPLKRYAMYAYAEVLWLFKKSLTVKKLPKEEGLAYSPIDTKGPRSLPLKTSKKAKNISSNAHFFVCNYAMYVIADYIKRKKLKTKFYFIHIPLKPTTLQQQEAIVLIKGLIYGK